MGWLLVDKDSNIPSIIIAKKGVENQVPICSLSVYGLTFLKKKKDTTLERVVS
jgi:hypothetical protein